VTVLRCTTRIAKRVFTGLQDQRKVQNNVEGNKTASREIKKEKI
jgi:hypothetical protein